MHKREIELFRLTKTERKLADRAYFASRLKLLIERKRTKRVKVKEAAVEQLPLFPSD
jgi:hypothetical protein